MTPASRPRSAIPVPTNATSPAVVSSGPVLPTARELDGVAGRLDAMPDADAAAALKRCCHSARWVAGVMAARPLRDGAGLLEAVGRAEAGLTREDWLDAFAGHPRIGDDPEALRKKFAGTAAWSETEQSGVLAAGGDVIAALAAGNRAYESRFGHIFIVCATGKSAGEMLALLHGRSDNPPEMELRIAAAEQAKITRIRLARL